MSRLLHRKRSMSIFRLLRLREVFEIKNISSYCHKNSYEQSVIITRLSSNNVFLGVIVQGIVIRFKYPGSMSPAMPLLINLLIIDKCKKGQNHSGRASYSHLW